MPEAPEVMTVAESHGTHGTAETPQSILRDLTEVDERDRLLAARRQALPETAEVHRLESEVHRLRGELSAADRMSDDLGSRLLRLKQDASKLRARRRDDISGLRAETDQERRRDLKHDLTVAERRLGELEEAIDREERTRAAFSGTSGTGQDARRKLDEAAAALDHARDEEKMVARDIENQRHDLAEASEMLRSRLPEDVRERYETGERENGVGAAVLADAVCRSCFMSIDRASLARIRSAPADALVSCPECGSLLIREDV